MEIINYGLKRPNEEYNTGESETKKIKLANGTIGLPQEILYSILVCLPVKDQRRARRVCKLWNEFFTNNRVLITAENFQRNQFFFKNVNTKLIPNSDIRQIATASDVLVFLTRDNKLMAYNFLGDLSFSGVISDSEKWVIKNVGEVVLLVNTHAKMIRAYRFDPFGRNQSGVIWEKENFIYQTHYKVLKEKESLFEINGIDTNTKTVQFLHEKTGAVRETIICIQEDQNKRREEVLVRTNGEFIFQVFSDNCHLFYNRRTKEKVEKQASELGLPQTKCFYSLVHEYLIVWYFSNNECCICTHSLDRIFKEKGNVVPCSSLKWERKPTEFFFLSGQSSFALHTNEEILLFKMHEKALTFTTISTCNPIHERHAFFEGDHFVLKYNNSVEIYNFSGKKVVEVIDLKSGFCLYKQGTFWKTVQIEEYLSLSYMKKYF